MFNPSLNIIITSNRDSGKTMLLLEISRILKESGYKICFIGGTNGLEVKLLPTNYHNIYELTFFIKNEARWDMLMMESIKEITERDNYDYIIIDDIDYLTDDCISILESINISKISTCSNDTLSDFFRIRNTLVGSTNWELLNIKGKKVIKVNDDLVSLDDMVIILIRDEKIKSILK